MPYIIIFLVVLYLGYHFWKIILSRLNMADRVLLYATIPDGMIANANYTYEARVEVLAATYECYNGMADPRPGQKIEKSPRQYANILEFKRVR
jgi:hypothetical protein